MVAQLKTPGVYIVEKNAFPNSVVQVPTAVPVFIGYTEQAQRGTRDVTGQPIRLTSLEDYLPVFGGPPLTVVTEVDDALAFADDSRFLLYHGLRMFFDNGGSDCYVVSVGDYGAAPTAEQLTAPLARNGPLDKEPEPTMVVIPDAVELTRDDWKTCSEAMLSHCIRMQSRVALLDVHDGMRARTFQDDDVITRFRKLAPDPASFGIGYYPWLNTTLYEVTDVTLDNVSEDLRRELAALVKKDGDARIADLPDAQREAAQPSIDLLVAGVREDQDGEQEHARNRRIAHLAALEMSESYRKRMAEIQKHLNLMPPAAAMAGVYARTDRLVGVFKAPANISIMGVESPAETISDAEQRDLNAPIVGGIAVNAIRTFVGRGVRVWGARTMDGNSQDWRYVNVRRTAIMLEQSMKNALQAYVFEPNTASTWTTVRNMLSNFLDNQWKAGALMGAVPEDAYRVDIGLGSTMTPNDVLDGYMKIVVRVALVRPAEFIVLTFQQKLPTS